MLKRLSGLVTRLTGLLFALMLGFGAAAFAQSGPTGSLSGVAQDPSGASIAGAKVTAVHSETGLSRNATTNSEGQWTLSVLPVGKYKVTIEANGFKKAVADIDVEAAVPRVLDIQTGGRRSERRGQYHRRRSTGHADDGDHFPPAQRPGTGAGPDLDAQLHTLAVG